MAKLWCAATVNLNGGRTRDGGSVVGASVFYSSTTSETLIREPLNEVEKLDQELQVHFFHIYKMFNAFIRLCLILNITPNTLFFFASQNIYFYI